MALAPLRTKLKKALLLAAVGTFFLLKFVVDVITTTGGFEAGWLTLARQLFVAGAFGALYFLIESSNPKVAGMDGAVRSYVDLFYALAG